MTKTKIFFVDYDAKTRQSTIICREASIDENKTAHIQYKPFGTGSVIDREAGDYVTAEAFNNYWHRALEDKCKKMIEEKENE